MPWRDLPERFGRWKSVYNRFSSWAKKGPWATLFKELQREVDETGAIVDASVVRAHQDASFAHTKMRRAERGPNAMLLAVLEEVFNQTYVVVDTKGRPMHIALNAGAAARDDRDRRAPRPCSPQGTRALSPGQREPVPGQTGG